MSAYYLWAKAFNDSNHTLFLPDNLYEWIKQQHDEYESPSLLDGYPYDRIEAFTKLHLIENEEFVLPAQYHTSGLRHHMELIMSETDKDTPFLEIFKLLCVQLGTDLLSLSTDEN